MSKLSEHFGYDTGNYGRKLAIGLSVGLHLVVLIAGAVISYAAPKKEQPIMVHRVKLGGPANMNLGGKERKAPVVGRAPKPKNTTRRPAQKKTPPKSKEKQVGLKKNTRKKKPPTAKPTPKAEDKTERAGRSQSQPTPEPEKDVKKSARAIGGLGGESGVAVALGDGAPDVNLEDMEFITYYKVLQARVLERWAGRGLSGGAATISFYVDREGRVSDVKVAKSSGLGYLDGPAKRAVMGLELPPLPQSYKGEALILNLVFDYDHKK